MGRARRLLLSLVLPVIIVVSFAASVAAAGHAGKVDVCHFASHKYVEINVSVNALPAHLRHGDVMPDEYGNCP
jgi:hypothetical protein